MADAEQRLRIVTEYKDEGVSDNLKKAQAQIINFSDAVEKSGKKVSKSFEEQQKTGVKANKTLSDSFNALKGSTLAAIAALGGTIAVIGKIVSEIEESDKAIKKLNFAFKTSGITSQEAVNKYKNFAKAIQETTTVSDEAVLSLGTFLTSAGIGFDQLEKASKASIELSARFGMSLEEAGSSIARTYAGSARELGKLIPEIGRLSEAQLRAGDSTDIIIRKFGGSASQDRDTLTGSFNVLKNSIGEAAESMEVVFGPAIELATTLIKKAALSVDELTGKLAGISGGGGTKLEQFQAQLREIDNAIAKNKAIADSGSNGLSGNNYFEQKVTELTRERANLLRDINNLQKESTNEISKQVDFSAKQRANAEKEIKAKEMAEKLKPKLDQVINDIKKEGQTEIQNILEQHDLRVKTINEARRLRLISAQEEADFYKLNDEARLKNIKELQEKSLEDSSSSQDKITKGVQGVTDIVGMAEKNPAGTAIGSIWGPAGAMIGNMIEDAIKGIIKMLPNILSMLVKDIGNVVFGLGKSIGSFFKSVGGLSSLFGEDPKFYKNFGDAIKEKLDGSEFIKSIQRLTESIERTADSFRSLPERLANAQGGLKFLRGTRGSALDAVYDQIGVRSSDFAYKQNIIKNYQNSGMDSSFTTQVGFEGSLKKAFSENVDIKGGTFRIKNAEKFSKAVEALGAQLQDEASRIMDIANLKIQKFADKIQVLGESLSRLTSERSGVATTFKNAIDAVSGALRSPEQTVALLMGQFSTAKGEAKGLLGGKLAGALQNQFSAAQNLASQGAITGEELAQIQADILSQLESTQTESLSEFDKLIASNEKQQAALQKKIDELKAEAVKQVDKLSEILNAIKTGNFGAIPKYANGTDYVPRTGLALVHQGERIVSPENRMQSGGGIVININGVSASGSTKAELVKIVQDALKTNLGGFRAQVGKA